MAEPAGVITVDGVPVRVTNPGRLLFPAAGTTKADVIGYYARAADAMLPVVAGRPATRKRWPTGTGGQAFFVKDLEAGTPAWLPRVQLRHDGGPKFYPMFGSRAALAWLGQVAALELHVPQWRIPASAGPDPDLDDSERIAADRVVFDLDPGEGAGLAECVQVALALRDRLGPLGAVAVPVTSGSKGIHVYVPLTEPTSPTASTEWAHLVALEMERALPDLVVSNMAKHLRVGKILIDWSQNVAAKTTIAPYSLRGRDQPTVAAPRGWAELAEPGLRHLHYREVLDRLADGVDPFVGFGGRPVVSTEPTPLLRVSVAAPPTQTRPAAGRSPRSEQPPVRVPAPADLLSGPVEVALARAQDTVPAPHALPGSCWYEVKLDGFRGVITHGRNGIRIWSRQKRDLTAAFPDIAAAALQMIRPGCVIDGELTIWQGDKLSFDALQHRLVGNTRRIGELAARQPASYLAFDLLAMHGDDVRGLPLRDRRAALENLAAGWRPPLQLVPVTTDRDTALDWMSSMAAAGVEGIVAKGAGSRYEGGRHGWVKTRTRSTRELLIGAVTGPISRPTTIIAGLYRDDRLVIVGRSGPLTAAQSRSLGPVLESAGVDHPWPDTIIANRFGGSRARTEITRVAPTVVAEVDADTAEQDGYYRHALRFRRFRPDLTSTDLPVLPSHASTG